MRVRWTNRAVDDLVHIGRFVAKDNPKAARRLVQQLKRRGDDLSLLPRSGRCVPEFPGTGYRELILNRYRLVYRIGAGDVEILVVFESHRKLMGPLA